MCYAPISAQPSPLGQELCRSAMGNVESDMESSRKTSKTLTEPPCHSRTTTPGFSIPRSQRRVVDARSRSVPVLAGASSNPRCAGSRVSGPAPGRLGNFVPSARSPAPGGVPIFHGFPQDDTDTSALAPLSGLQSNPPDRFSRAHLRTLQRRVQQWRGIKASNMVYPASATFLYEAGDRHQSLTRGAGPSIGLY